MLDDRVDDDTVSVSRVELHELMAEVRSLRDRVRTLEVRGEALVVPAPADTEPHRVGRRRAIVGLAGAAAGAVAALGPASPAAAANGGNVVLGSDVNSSTLPTGIGVQGSGAAYGFGVTDNIGHALSQAPALIGHAKGANFSVGVYGQGEGFYTGVRGEALDVGTGVVGESENGIGGEFRSSGADSVTLYVTNEASGDAGTGLYMTGHATHLSLSPSGRAAPPLDTLPGVVGQVRWTADGSLWGCTVAGTPGTWRRLTGVGVAGQLTVLPAPARVYDSRPGTAPTTVGPKTKFAAGQTRTFDLKANSSGVPSGATAALVTLLLVNASTTPGNLTIWANGVSKPLANTTVWGGSAGRFGVTAVTAVDPLARVQVNASQPTDLVIDVVGYYR